MNWTPVVRQLKDGQDVSAAVVNVPISALSDRTQYLYERMEASFNNSRLMAMAQPVADVSVGKYSVVYYDGVTTNSIGLKLTVPKLANLNDFPFFRGADSAHVFGIVSDAVVNNTANVCLQGLLASANDDVVGALLDQPDTSFISGPLYLSGVVAGKLTPVPNGLSIFVAYAKNRHEVYINPNQESLSELFWSFRYSILDRPAGEVSFNTGSSLWTMAAPSPTKVGWVRATDKLSSNELAVLFPDGLPTYYYQLPDRAVIESNDNIELTNEERAAAINLRAAFPAKANAFSFLSVNGVLYSPRLSSADRGTYVLNELGLWWFRDSYDPATSDLGEFDQPWASDLHRSLVIDTDQTSGQNIYLKNAEGTAITDLDTTPGFKVNEVIRFFAGTTLGGVAGVLPAPLSDTTDYIIKSVSGDYFTIAELNDPDVTITLTDAGTAPWHLKWKPTFWRIAKGSTYRRPLMNLQFTKLNPEARQNMVTSLQADPAVPSPAIKVTTLTTSTPAVTGDLKLKLALPVINGWDGQQSSIAAGQAVKGLYYNPGLERLELALGNVVSEIRNGGGLKIETDSTGVYTVSFANAYANAITEIEPEQARFEYYGLNSFLALDYSTTATGFVGKFILPDQLVAGANNYLSLIMMLFGKSGTSSSTKTVRFKFEYAVAHLNKPLAATTITVPTVNLDLPITGNSYPQYSLFETPATAFRIPVSELSPKATVNFRLTRLRTEPTAGLYTGIVGMSNVYWLLS